MPMKSIWPVAWMLLASSSKTAAQWDFNFDPSRIFGGSDPVPAPVPRPVPSPVYVPSPVHHPQPQSYYQISPPYNYDHHVPAQPYYPPLQPYFPPLQPYYPPPQPYYPPPPHHTHHGGGGSSFCSMPPDRGSCPHNSVQHRWYYDSTVQDCLQFVYNGCGGSPNKFNSRAACQQACRSVAQHHSHGINVYGQGHVH